MSGVGGPQLIRTTYPNRAAWLEGRQKGIGASEAAAILGLSPWSNPMKLWRLKMGMDKPKDLSANPAVEQGNRLEPVLRTMFQALHPEYQLEYHQFDMLAQEDAPQFYATLDGELVREDGEQGILEIKTATMSSAAAWEKWKDAVPQNYYIQVLHQFMATGYSFAYLFAALFDLNGGVSLRTYTFDRADCLDDINFLREKETEFWGHVQAGTLPSMVLAL